MSSCALKNDKNRITNPTPCDNYCNYIAHNFMLEQKSFTQYPLYC